MKFTFCAALLLATITQASGALTNGAIALSENDFQPGAHIELSGQWLFKPGYAVATAEKPEAESSDAGFVPVAVPQLLNRVYWWLDDSEDFKRHENERLARMGFDTERADDGWYRLKLNLPVIPQGRHLFLEFDGVAMKCRVFCNGRFLGDHQGMFSRFSFDLTSGLHPGANDIAVYVSMEKIPASSLSLGKAVTVNLTASKVETMSKGMYGPLWPGSDNRSYDLYGIWQPVRLVARGDSEIDNVWFVPSQNGGELTVKAHLFEPQAVTIKAKWVNNKTGRTLAIISQPVSLSGNAIISQTINLRHVHPKLWTPADPNLYRLQVTLENDRGKTLDQWNGKVGFRTFEIRGNKFYLNGHPWWLRGANHLPYGKNPWDPQLPRKLIQYLHDAHINITRTHATPWNEAWLDAADEIGLGVSLEGIRPWGLSGKIGPTPPAMFQQWLMENQDVVERCRNHPSVLIYTIGNEIMLKDPTNLVKWKQLSAVIKQTREIDPTRPIIASSEYQRDPKFYQTVLKPSGIDDGDIDDMHRYNNWYGPSSFVTDSEFKKEMKANGGTRPLIGQEMSTGYPDLDSGLPTLSYTRDLLTPQAWVGPYSYPGSDPAIFLEHHRAVTKRWAEQLRFQRGTNTAGFMLFAAECWFRHSYDSETVSPYPAYEAMSQADAPVGLAWETGRRRFFVNEKLDTAVFISNDDDQYRDFHNLRLEVSFPGAPPRVLARVDELPYGKTIRVPVQVTLPSIDAPREKMEMLLQLKRGHKLISETSDPAEIFQRRNVKESPDVILLKSGASLDSLAAGKPLRERIENGATAIVFSPGSEIIKLFPKAVRDSKKVDGEYADFSPIAGTPLARDLQPMDLKWWGRTNDWRTFVASRAEHLITNGPARQLIRFIPPHGYVAFDKVADERMTVMWELRLGKGRLWVCDLDLDQCAGVDPAAELFEENLYHAAADPASTSSLPKVLSHEELLTGRHAGSPP